jgi:hypothetical protein
MDKTISRCHRGPGPKKGALSYKKQVDIAIAESVRASWKLKSERCRLEAATLSRMQRMDKDRWHRYQQLFKEPIKQPEVETPPDVFCIRCITTPAETECELCQSAQCSTGSSVVL